MLVSNKYRGEFVITIDKEYLLRPTFNAICEIESKANCGLFELIQRFKNKEFKTVDILAVIWGGLVGANSDITFAELTEKIIEQGIVEFVKPATEFLILAINERK